MPSASSVSSLAQANIAKVCYEQESLKKLFQDTIYNDLKWYVVLTYSCREQVVARSFVSKGICCYLPLLSEKRRWSDRIKTIQVPLFKNYIFVKIAPVQEDFWKIISTRGVARILGDDKGPIAIADKEIETVAHMSANKVKLKVVCGFQGGQPVRVKAGPLRGMKGCFVRMKGRDHLAVNIGILGQSILAEVSYCDVESC